MKPADSGAVFKSFMVTVCTLVVFQIMISILIEQVGKPNHQTTTQTTRDTRHHLDEWSRLSPNGLPGILLAEAGKKKKKEKSEVVVISVNNPQKGGYGGYPIFIPSCGGHGGFGRR